MMIRKTLLLGVLLGIGYNYVFYLQFFVSTKIYLGFIAGVGLCLTVTLISLWDDLIPPLFRRPERS